MDQDPRHWIAALRSSHNALMARVKSLSPEDLTAPSYCKDWDVSQVISHLGSGAEISLLGLERAADGRPAMAREMYPQIWDRWNGMTPEERAVEMPVWDRRSVSVAEGLDDATLASIEAEFFGMQLRAADLMALRLGEHALHSWDVSVTFDDKAELRPDAVELLVDRAAWVAERTGKPGPTGKPKHFTVHVTGPERHFALSIADKVSLVDANDSPPPGAIDGTFNLPAAALVRLVYGRLDPAHTPAEVSVEGDADLDELRRVFPGL